MAKLGKICVGLVTAAICVLAVYAAANDTRAETPGHALPLPVRTPQSVEADRSQAQTLPPSHEAVPGDDAWMLDQDEVAPADYSAPPDPREPIDPAVTNVLLIGTDAPGDTLRGRARYMIILSLSGHANGTTMVSVAADMLGQYPDGQSNRMGAAYSLGGAHLAMQVVNKAFGLDISHYLLLPDDVLRAQADRLTGVPVNITAGEAERINAALGTAHAEGLCTLSGEALLRLLYDTTPSAVEFSLEERQRRGLLSFFVHSGRAAGKTLLTGGVSSLFGLMQTNLSGAQTLNLALSLFAKGMQYDGFILPQPDTWRFERFGERRAIIYDGPANTQALHDWLYRRP